MASVLDVDATLNQTEPMFVSLGGALLTVDQLIELGRGSAKIKIDNGALDRVKKTREMLQSCVDSGQRIYGTNTGFGKLATEIIPLEDLSQLQLNLLRSHASGLGPCLSLDLIRIMFALRINVLAKGYSGFSAENLERMVKIFNASCLSYVPEQGTVGASGDLAPLAHLALGMVGEGKMWDPSGRLDDASKVLQENQLSPLVLGPKEGLCLINGTQFMSALGCDALSRSSLLAKTADVVAAMSLRGLKGKVEPFDPALHELRPHEGQIKVARRMRALLLTGISDPGADVSSLVQDPYSLRCIPQVHGIVNDTIEFVGKILTTEINSTTDNPIVVLERQSCICGGNFHGEYVAKALDYLAIGVHELASISERRIERMINPAYSHGLPAFLACNSGLNSGFMVAHCAAAALVSENKVLCHPSSVDSQTTSAGTEDHVSMGGFSARKAIQVVKNVEKVLAIELLAACQSWEFTKFSEQPTALKAVYDLVRSVSKKFDTDRVMSDEIETVLSLVSSGQVLSVVRDVLPHEF